MRFRLSPPGLPILLLSLALAGVAVAALYMRVPVVGHFVSAHRFWIMTAAYAVLLAGVIFRGL